MREGEKEREGNRGRYLGAGGKGGERQRERQRERETEKEREKEREQRLLSLIHINRIEAGSCSCHRHCTMGYNNRFSLRCNFSKIILFIFYEVNFPGR